MKGRKPQPTSTRRLRGNPGKRAYNAEEPEPTPFDDVGVPAELRGDRVAAAEWTRLSPMLKRCRQITEADRSALIACCAEWSNYVNARKKATPRIIGKRPNPYATQARAALTALFKLWPELGLTPSSRTRIKTTAADPTPGGDAFSEFDDKVFGDVDAKSH